MGVFFLAKKRRKNYFHPLLYSLSSLDIMNPSDQNENENENDISDAVRAALARKGVLSSLKAKLRAEVFHVLENKVDPMPEKTKEMFLATELVRELLVNLRLDNTLSVFMEELGQPQEARIDRSYIASEIGMSTSNTDIPLLVLLVDHLISSKEERLTRQFASTDVSFDPLDI